jgi:hypothetical protein
MAGLMSLLSWSPTTELLSYAEQPSLFVDGRSHLLVESVADDLLGERMSAAVRASLARDASRTVTDAAAQRLNVEGGPARFQLASALFRAFGEGRMRLENVDGRRRGAGMQIHASECAARWTDEGFRPGAGTDAYAAGWLGASLEAALGRAPNSVEARQAHALEAAGETVFFDLGKGDSSTPRIFPSQSALDRRARLSRSSQPGSLAQWLRAEMEAAADPEVGLSMFLGVPVTLKPMAYYAGLVATCRQAVKGSGLEATVDEAFTEAWRLGSLSLLHRLGRSSTWKSMLAAHGGNLGALEVVDEVYAAWGWGRFTIRPADNGVTLISDAPAEGLFSASMGFGHMSLMAAGLGQAVADASLLERRGLRAESTEWRTWMAMPPAYDVRIVECAGDGGDRTVVETVPAAESVGRLRRA